MAGESLKQAQMESEEPESTSRAGKLSREFLWVAGLAAVLVLAAGGYRGWQSIQAGPELKLAQEFIQTNLEPSSPPHLARAAMNGQVLAFYKENGPVQSVLSQRLESKQQNPFGDTVCVTKSEVKTPHGPVLVTIKIKNHQGDRSVVSMVYEPES